jgi:hypothetical protein
MMIHFIVDSESVVHPQRPKMLLRQRSASTEYASLVFHAGTPCLRFPFGWEKLWRSKCCRSPWSIPVGKPGLIAASAGGVESRKEPCQSRRSIGSRQTPPLSIVAIFCESLAITASLAASSGPAASSSSKSSCVRSAVRRLIPSV